MRESYGELRASKEAADQALKEKDDQIANWSTQNGIVVDIRRIFAKMNKDLIQAKLKRLTDAHK